MRAQLNSRFGNWDKPKVTLRPQPITSRLTKTTHVVQLRNEVLYLVAMVFDADVRDGGIVPIPLVIFFLGLTRQMVDPNLDCIKKLWSDQNWIELNTQLQYSTATKECVSNDFSRYSLDSPQSTAISSRICSGVDCLASRARDPGINSHQHHTINYTCGAIWGNISCFAAIFAAGWFSCHAGPEHIV